MDHFTGPVAQDEVTNSVQRDRCSVEVQLNPRRIGTRLDEEIVFKLLASAVKNDVYARIDFVDTNSSVQGDIASPTRSITADEVVHASCLRIETLDYCMRIGFDELQTDEVVRFRAMWHE